MRAKLENSSTIGVTVSHVVFKLAELLAAPFEPGQVLATQATIARSRTRFRTEPLEPFLVKGKSDPVHAVRAHAREMLVVGPTPDDPFTICKEMADALPHDRGAAGLCDTWREELDQARRRE